MQCFVTHARAIATTNVSMCQNCKERATQSISQFIGNMYTIVRMTIKRTSPIDTNLVRRLVQCNRYFCYLYVTCAQHVDAYVLWMCAISIEPETTVYTRTKPSKSVTLVQVYALVTLFCFYSSSFSTSESPVFLHRLANCNVLTWTREIKKTSFKYGHSYILHKLQFAIVMYENRQQQNVCAHQMPNPRLMFFGIYSVFQLRLLEIFISDSMLKSNFSMKNSVRVPHTHIPVYRLHQSENKWINNSMSDLHVSWLYDADDHDHDFIFIFILLRSFHFHWCIHEFIAKTIETMAFISSRGVHRTTHVFSIFFLYIWKWNVNVRFWKIGMPRF